MDFFLSCVRWAGEIENAEPSKCSELVWQAVDDLPNDTIPYVRSAIEKASAGICILGVRLDIGPLVPNDARERAVAGGRSDQALIATAGARPTPAHTGASCVLTRGSAGQSDPSRSPRRQGCPPQRVPRRPRGSQVERCLYKVGPVVGEQALLRFEAQCLGRVAVHPRVGLGAAEHGQNRIRVEVATKPDTVVERGKFGEASETTPSCGPLVRSSSKTLSTSGNDSTTVVGRVVG